jgi:signal transduction histidine kinase/CheY-like chemotaxis protein
MLELNHQVAVIVIGILTLLLVLLLFSIANARKKFARSQEELIRKNQQFKQQELDFIKKEYEKKFADLKAKSEAGFGEERAKTDRALSELEQHKEISRIAAGVSNEQAKKIHSFTEIANEFRNPLSNIIQSLEDLLAGAYGKIQGKTRRQLETTLRNSRHLLRFVDQFHDISHLQSGKMEIQRSKQDLVRFLREIVQTMIWYAEKRGINLNLETTVEEMEVYFDVRKMAEVFYHLLSNAFKFTEDDGKILISISELPAEELDTDEDSARISVRNSGPAISEEDIPHVFDFFHRSVDISRPRFGLSLVKELVSLHGGSIHARSEPGIGTEFTIFLPKGAIAAAASRDVPEDKTFDFSERARMELSALESEETKPRLKTPTNMIPGNSGSILIVEDNDSLRELLKGGLREFFTVREARNGIEALDKLRERKPDLIITDVMMPEMDGLDFCRTVKTDPEFSHVPVILITAKSTEGSRVEGMEAGADAYISKPFGFEELLRKIEFLTKPKTQQQTTLDHF